MKMNLPVFDIPLPNLGFDIPILAHPPIVHFAIVIPVFILILEIINLVMKRRGLTVTTFVFFTLLVVIYFAAFATGKTDGSEAWDLLTSDGQTDLKEHKLIGIYLMLGTVVLFFAKLFSMALRTWWMKLLYLLLLVGFVGAVFFQGKEGGELVYKHGANVERVLDLSNEVDDCKEELEELQEESGEATESETEATTGESEAPAQEAEKATETETEAPAKTEEPKAEEKEEASETAAPVEEKAASEATETASEQKEEENSAATPQEANSTSEAAEEAAKTATEAVSETTTQAVEATKEAAEKAAETTKAVAKEAVESVKEAAKPVTDMIKKAADAVTGESK